MKMITITIFSLMFSVTSTNLQAAIVNGSTLSIDSGSFFNLSTPEGLLVYGSIPLTGIDGVVLGSSQPWPTGATDPGIDNFIFLGANGHHYTTSPTNVLSANNGTATIDFTGWSWGFNGFEIMNLGTGSWGTNPDGVAEINCNAGCGNGDTYMLYYTATAPSPNLGGYDNYTYELVLNGTISSVPVPAAAWLFGSGIIGIFGLARRRQ